MDTLMRKRLMMTLMLILLFLLVSQRLTPQDTSYSSQQYTADLLLLIASRESLKKKLDLVLQENELLKKSLSEEQKNYNELVQSAMSESDSSIDSLEKALVKIRALRKQLSDLEATATSLLQEIKDNEKKYQDLILKAQTDHDAAMKAKDDEIFWTRLWAIISTAAAVFFGVKAVINH